ncbi:MAG: hypothetical protein WC307_01195 [Candidatus Nanoarchaeia archaeon]|jgi:hypothetical protein
MFPIKRGNNEKVLLNKILSDINSRENASKKELTNKDDLFLRIKELIIEEKKLIIIAPQLADYLALVNVKELNEFYGKTYSELYDVLSSNNDAYSKIIDYFK